jgi:hypothetical protein
MWGTSGSDPFLWYAYAGDLGIRWAILLASPRRRNLERIKGVLDGGIAIVRGHAPRSPTSIAS